MYNTLTSTRWQCPESAVHMAQSDKGVTFSWLPETPTGDGFIWRKYGQKVISNTFIRSYYKCTNANCPARKQIQSSRDGHITELIYTLEHKHLKPPHTSMVASSDNLMEVAVTQSIGSEVNNISPDLKKRYVKALRYTVKIVFICLFHILHCHELILEVYTGR